MVQADIVSDPLLADVAVHEGYKVLGGVVLYQKLGQGGMGAVYRGRHLRLNVDVAVKVMDPPAGVQVSSSGEFVQRFIREAQTAAAVSHQNLIRVYDVNAESGVHFLIMEFVDGESAGDRLKRKGQLSEVEALKIALGAAEGLAEAHRRGVVHRDVKPDNVMIDKEGHVRVTDLGLAKAASGESDSGPGLLTQTQSAMGTPCYMPPEQFASARDVKLQADVWSLGVTLYQLLTGSLPWAESSVFALAAKIQSEPLPDPKGLRPGLSDGACGIITRALRKQASERYADCGQMGKALRAHLASIGSGEDTDLADPKAGATRMALATMSPPAPQTLTFIGKTLVGASARPASTDATRPVPAARATHPTARAAPRTRAGYVPAAVIGAALLLAVGVWAVLSTTGGEPDQRPATFADPLEAEALQFLGRVKGIAGDGRLEEASRLITEAGGKYDATVAGPKLARLAQTLAAKIEAKQQEADDRLRREEARRAKLLADAERSEKAGDLETAFRFLRDALAIRDDATVREHIARIEGGLASRKLIEEARRHEAAGKLTEAERAYQKAMPDALGADRDEAEKRLAAVRRRIAAEQAVAGVSEKIRTGEWRAAWDALEAAEAKGLEHSRLKELAAQAARQLAPKRALTDLEGIELVLIPGGTFKMGTDAGADHEKPVHEVTVSGFYIGKHEVTQSQYEAIMGTNPSRAKGADLPVEQVSWTDAAEFCRRLSGRTGTRFRLPTEAEWEYAARGSESRKYPWGEAPPGPEHANLAGGADGHELAAPVGSFRKGTTPEGVHDLAGNLAEWCADWIDRYPSDAARDPSGPREGRMKVIRGGTFIHGAAWARAAGRSGRKPDDPVYLVGFRVVRELTSEERKFGRLTAGE